MYTIMNSGLMMYTHKQVDLLLRNPFGRYLDWKVTKLAVGWLVGSVPVFVAPAIVRVVVLGERNWVRGPELEKVVHHLEETGKRVAMIGRVGNHVQLYSAFEVGIDLVARKDCLNRKCWESGKLPVPDIDECSIG